MGRQRTSSPVGCLILVVMAGVLAVLFIYPGPVMKFFKALFKSTSW